jgi:hypothetical protein
VLAAASDRNEAWRPFPRMSDLIADSDLTARARWFKCREHRLSSYERTRLSTPYIALTRHLAYSIFLF